MKIIIDIEDHILGEMLVAADIKQVSLEKMLSEMFMTYHQAPLDHLSNIELNEIEKFRIVFSKYIEDAVLDLQNLGLATQKEDNAMIKVFKHLGEILSDNSFVLSELHKTYKENKTTL